MCCRPDQYKKERPHEPASSGTLVIHTNFNRLERKMEAEKDGVWQIWIIRWDPYRLECKSGTRKEVEEYARKKAEETGHTYVIN